MSNLSRSQRRYLAAALASFGVGVGYVLLVANMMEPATHDPYSSPVAHSLATSISNLMTAAVIGLIALPLALGAIYHWVRQVPGVDRGPGCASILFSAMGGVVLASVASASLAPPAPPVEPHWQARSESAGFSVEVPSLFPCGSHPAVGFAPKGPAEQ